MSQRPKTEAASLLHTLRLLRPQIFRRWSFYKGPLLRFIHISLEVMVDSEKGCSKCTKPLLPYLSAIASHSLTKNAKHGHFFKWFRDLCMIFSLNIEILKVKIN